MTLREERWENEKEWQNLDKKKREIEISMPRKLEIRMKGNQNGEGTQNALDWGVGRDTIRLEEREGMMKMKIL